MPRKKAVPRRDLGRPETRGGSELDIDLLQSPSQSEEKAQKGTDPAASASPTPPAKRRRLEQSQLALVCTNELGADVLLLPPVLPALAAPSTSSAACNGDVGDVSCLQLLDSFEQAVSDSTVQLWSQGRLQGNVAMPLSVYTSLRQAVESAACVLVLPTPSRDSHGVLQHRLQLGLRPSHLQSGEGVHLGKILPWYFNQADDQHLAIPQPRMHQHGVSAPSTAETWEPLHAARVYDHVKPSGQEPALDMQLPQLLPQLRPYQRRAAGWMVAHEMGLGKTVELLACLLANPFPGPALPESLKQVPARRKGERIECVCGAIDEHSGTHAAQPGELWLQCDACEAWLHGGCVGHARQAPKGEWVCRRCLRHQASMSVTMDCGATLIVCPEPILQQWRSEIARHTRPGAVKVLVYDGQAQNLGLTASVSAAQLAEASVVLTTYDVLKRDLNHEPGQAGAQRSLRFGKKYEVIPTPLTRLRWWRVVLDEAQMVESPSSPATAMAAQLPAVHRWAVSGTPLSHDARDLVGLLSFLRAPAELCGAWRRLCQGNASAQQMAIEALRPASGGLLWRNSKADVQDELGIPPQTHNTTMLQMSPIERHFYARQHQECVAAAQKTLPTALLSAAAQSAAQATLRQSEEQEMVVLEGARGAELDRQLKSDEAKRVWLPLLRLRQACCHPQIGSRGIRSLQHSKAPLTMPEILEVLLAKARVEAEDAQRLLFGALNGLAALMLLDARPADAVALYRQVLKTAEGNQQWIRADPLQRFHTLYNLGQLLGIDKQGQRKMIPGVAPTLRDEGLHTEASAISQEYMAQWIARNASAHKDYAASLRASQDISVPSADSSPQGRRQNSSAAGRFGPWVAEVLDVLYSASSDRGERASEAIKERLLEMDQYRQPSGQNATGLARRFSTLAGLKLLLVQELEAMLAARSSALEPLDSLAAACLPPSDDLVLQAGQCGRCRSELGESGRVCAHCRLDERCLAWEMRLHSVHTRALVAGTAVSAEDALRQAQAAALRRVGQGGLNEVAGEGDLGTSNGPSSSTAAPVSFSEAGPRRGDTLVSETEVQRQPSEAEQAIRLAVGQLRNLRGVSDPELAARRSAALEAGKATLEWLEAERKLLIKGRALALAQRALLYAADEMAMARMRLRVRLPGEAVRLHEAHFKLHEAELPVKNKELTMDRIASEADLGRALGTLRYLRGLRAAQEQKQKSPPTSPHKPLSPSDITLAAPDPPSQDPKREASTSGPTSGNPKSEAPAPAALAWPGAAAHHLPNMSSQSAND
ncbi:hypothetical protein WJX73_010752 [Symbiochloris irregularis]|uniref:PHD-type domain-containing protein n=1 Tax=Symbiochloris irregularis TaxID=706552 RepID=A0AAW1NS42_9CHLO